MSVQVTPGRLGRPKLRKAQKRLKVIKVGATADEFVLIRAKSRAAGHATVAAYVREKALA